MNVFKRSLNGELVEYTIDGIPQRLGDKIERIVKPIAKAIQSPCLDKDGNLKPDSKCRKIRDKLNQWTTKA